MTIWRKENFVAFGHQKGSMQWIEEMQSFLPPLQEDFLKVIQIELNYAEIMLI